MTERVPDLAARLIRAARVLQPVTELKRAAKRKRLALAAEVVGALLGVRSEFHTCAHSHKLNGWQIATVMHRTGFHATPMPCVHKLGASFWMCCPLPVNAVNAVASTNGGASGAFHFVLSPLEFRANEFLE